MKDLNIQKLYYSISEVSKITDIEQHVLRYWETEFAELKPSKNRAGNRNYTNRDINIIILIKKMLREERYTIEGAKKALKEHLEKQNSLENKAVEKTKLKANINNNTDVDLFADIERVNQRISNCNLEINEQTVSKLMQIREALVKIYGKL